MNTAATYNEQNISQLDALWALFLAQPKYIRKALRERMDCAEEQLKDGLQRKKKEKFSNEITPELQIEIDHAMREHECGETLRFENKKDMHAWLESL